MVSRNATLQLMLNGQPLGTLPLGADGEDATHHFRRYANGKAKLRMDHHLIGRQGKADAPLPLPSDQVVIHSQLSLAVRVSPEMVSRNATLQLMLNGLLLETISAGGISS
jgi:hypothetical protein